MSNAKHHRKKRSLDIVVNTIHPLTKLRFSPWYSNKQLVPPPVQPQWQIILRYVVPLLQCRLPHLLTGPLELQLFPLEDLFELCRPTADSTKRYQKYWEPKHLVAGRFLSGAMGAPSTTTTRFWSPTFTTWPWLLPVAKWVWSSFWNTIVGASNGLSVWFVLCCRWWEWEAEVVMPITILCINFG